MLYNLVIDDDSGRPTNRQYRWISINSDGDDCFLFNYQLMCRRSKCISMFWIYKWQSFDTFKITFFLPVFCTLAYILIVDDEVCHFHHYLYGNDDKQMTNSLFLNVMKVSYLFIYIHFCCCHHRFRHSFHNRIELNSSFQERKKICHKQRLVFVQKLWCDEKFFFWS